MNTIETCKLRYSDPQGTDVRVERISRVEADTRKQKLEEMGWIVTLIEPLAASGECLRSRFGSMLDPKRMMN